LWRNPGLSREFYMKRVAVASSTIVAIGYDPDTSTLEVEFKNGTVYEYDGVPVEIYEGIMNSNSHGKYLNAHVKERFSFRRIR